MKYLAICQDCGKFLGQTKEFKEEELKDNLGQVMKIASLSFGKCPRCESDRVILKKDETFFGDKQN